ncbi:MAG: Maf family protein [Patescibacteria group bacterium]|nr:Maf family protein [Patescibacteria group bacterium]
MARPEKSPVPRRDREPKPQTVVVYAGTSPRRQSFIEHAFASPQFTVLGYPAGEEPEIDDVHKIMNGKIDYVLRKLQQEGKIKAKDKPIVIAADIRTRVLTHGDQEAGCTYTESRGKPKSTQEVQRMFRKMSQTSKRSSSPPFYIVESASGVQFNGDRISTKHTTIAVLNPEVVEYFSTDAGFADYQNNFARYYASRVYANNGKHPPAGVTDVAAGLSLPVLIESNAISELDGIPSNSPDFRQAVKIGIYNVGVGISPHLLRPVQPRIEQIINGWGWLEGCTAHVLGEVKELIL